MAVNRASSGRHRAQTTLLVPTKPCMRPAHLGPGLGAGAAESSSLAGAHEAREEPTSEDRHFCHNRERNSGKGGALLRACRSPAHRSAAAGMWPLRLLRKWLQSRVLPMSHSQDSGLRGLVPGPPAASWQGLRLALIDMQRSGG